MTRTPHPVLTIHGVSPDRTWQARVAAVLEPHFQCVAVSYAAYGSVLGAVAVLFNITLLLAAAAFAFVPLADPPWRAAAACGSLAASIAVAAYRRARVVDRVKAQLPADALRRRPHVIAHSFGSYVCGWALHKFHDLRLARVVLVGCVLPPRFDWAGILRRRPMAFIDVRNEVGLADTVVRLVKWSRWFARDLGPAGLDGFDGDGRSVHRSARPWGPCPRCPAPPGAGSALVHDWFLARYRHSDWALGAGHARELWLPHLWGLTPREFNEFVQCCRDAAYARQEEFWQELDAAERELRTRSWSWTNGLTLDGFLEAELDSRLERSTEHERVIIASERARILDDAFRFTYLAAADAYEESDQDVTAERHEIVLALYPPRAIARGLSGAIRLRIAP